MRQLFIALAIAVAGSGVSLLASQERDVMAPVRHFIAGFNKNDISMVAAACADETFIIDDFAPHEWAWIGSCLEMVS
jgi:hypothetical protein